MLTFLLRWAVLALACTSLIAGEALEPVTGNQMNLSDQLGCQWDLTTNSGEVNDGSNDCFDEGLTLQVNGQECQFTQLMQTKDHQELVITGTPMPGLTITRRIRVCTALSATRYLEIAENTSTAPLNLTLVVQSHLGGSAQSVVTTSGLPFTGGSLTGKDLSVLARQTPNSRPSVLFVVGGARGAVPATITVSNLRTFQFSWALTVPARGRVVIAHLVAQRRTAFDPVEETAALVKALAKSEIPRALLRSVVNLPVGTPADSGDLAELSAWCLNHSFERGNEDQLLTGSAAGQRASGMASGGPLTVTGAYGAQQVALTEIAAIVGGSDPGDPARIFLRDGQILVGALSGPDLVLTSSAGTLPIKVARTRGLVLHGLSSDRIPAARILVGLPTGDALLLAAAPPTMPVLMSMLGQLPLDAQVAKLIRDHDEPGWIATWSDGSHLHGLLCGPELELTSERGGVLRLPAQALETWRRGGVAVGEPDEALDHVELVGGDWLSGTLAGPTIVFTSVAGEIAVETARMISLQRSESDGTMVATLAGGSQIAGRPRSTSLGIVRPDGALWQIPLRHLDAWHKGVVDEPPPAPTADTRLSQPVSFTIEGTLSDVLGSLAAAMQLTLALTPAAKTRCGELQEVIDCRAESEPVDQLLDRMLMDSGLGYRLDGEQLIVDVLPTTSPGNEP